MLDDWLDGFWGSIWTETFFRSSGAEGRRDESALEQGQPLRWINLRTYADWLMYVNRVIGTGLDHLCWTKMSDSDGISMGFGALPARVCFDTPKLTSNIVLNLTQFGSYYPRFFITLVRFNFASLEVCDFRRSSWTCSTRKKGPSKSEVLNPVPGRQVFQDFVVKTQKLPGFKLKFELPTEALLLGWRWENEWIFRLWISIWIPLRNRSYENRFQN